MSETYDSTALEQMAEWLETGTDGDIEIRISVTATSYVVTITKDGKDIAFGYAFTLTDALSTALAQATA